jgi:hypothetical protein
VRFLSRWRPAGATGITAAGEIDVAAVGLDFAAAVAAEALVPAALQD